MSRIALRPLPCYASRMASNDCAAYFFTDPYLSVLTMLLSSLGTFLQHHMGVSGDVTKETLVTATAVLPMEMFLRPIRFRHQVGLHGSAWFLIELLSVKTSLQKVTSKVSDSLRASIPSVPVESRPFEYGRV